jgi:hypothetical protein
MTVKKQYEVGDVVWIAGVSRNNARLTQGTVIRALDLLAEGLTGGPYYVIAIPSHIETLLELRTWETISQDVNGPVGSLRDLGANIDATIRVINHVGFEAHDEEMPGDPTPEQIHAALEKSLKDSTHAPLNLKEPKPKDKFRTRKRRA